MSATDLATDPERPGPDHGQQAHEDARTFALPCGRASEWLSDRLNPILVREVRQSLRGRYFRFTFWLTLSAALLIGLFVIANGPPTDPYDTRGLEFFGTIFTCLCVAVHFFVPFSAFTAMGSEWDENTYDLLEISNLRPRQIVLGKLAAAIVQSALFFSAFVPFLAFSYVLRGVDLASIGVVIGAAFLISILLAAFAISLSSIARVRFARIALMAVLAIGLVYATAGAAASGYALARAPYLLRDTEFWMGVRIALTIGALLLVQFIVAAAGRLAHPEENRATGHRIVGALVPLCGLGWAAYTYYRMGRNPEVLEIATIMIFSALTVFALLATTEREELGRRTRLQVPRSRALALLAAPFLPGGGRGVLWFLGMLALTLAGTLAIFHFAPPSGGPGWSPSTLARAAPIAGSGLVGELLVLGTLALYFFSYLALPTGAMQRFTETVPGQRVVRAAAIVFLILSLTLPSIYAFVAGDMSDSVGLAHGGNPLWVFTQLKGDDPEALKWPIAVGWVALLAFVGNVPRISRGLREVLAASAEARAREGARNEPVRPREEDRPGDSGHAQAAS